MPGPHTIEIDPILIGPDREDERETATQAAARRALDAMGVDEALADVRVPPPPGMRPSPDPLAEEQAEADRVGAAYRASLRDGSVRQHQPQRPAPEQRRPRSTLPQQTPEDATPTPPPMQMEPFVFGAGGLQNAPTPTAAPVEMEPFVFGPDGLQGAPGPNAPPRPQPAGQGPEFVDPARPTPGRMLAEPTARAAAERMMRARAEQQVQAAPTQPAPDFTGADVNDAIRRPLHALGSGLRAAAGLSATPFRSERAAIEARLRGEAEQAAERSEAQRAADLMRQRLGLDERKMAAQERGLELESERNDISRAMQSRRADISTQRAQTAMEIARARLASIQSETEREAAALDPASEPSRIARVALRTAVAGYPGTARARLAEQLGVDETALDESFAGLNQRQAEQILDALPNMFRDTTNRRGGGGSGGAGAADSLADEIRAMARQAGMSEVEIAAYGGRRDGLEDLRQEAESRLGRSRGPGSSELRVRVAAAQDAIDALTSAIPEGDVPGFGRFDSLRGDGIFQSQEGQRLRVMAQNAVRRFLRLESGASISDQEMETEMRLRGMGVGASEERFRHGVRDLARDMRARIRALQSGGGGTGGSGDDGERVRVISPSGQSGTIPAAQLDRALNSGWRRAE